MDVCSGSVHVVDEVTYDAIALYENEEREVVAVKLKELYPNLTDEEIKEVLDEIDELREQELLYTEDVYKDYVIDVKKRTTIVKALCLHIAHDCNLACKYCFASEGEYHGDRALMSFEVGKKALDYLLENSGSRRNLEVDFFGGEPLINFKVVKDLVAYGRSKEEARRSTKAFRTSKSSKGKSSSKSEGKLAFSLYCTKIKRT